MDQQSNDLQYNHDNHQQQQSFQPAPPTPPRHGYRQQKRKARKKLIIILSIVLLLVIAACVIFFFSNNNGCKPELRGKWVLDLETMYNENLITKEEYDKRHQYYCETYSSDYKITLEFISKNRVTTTTAWQDKYYAITVPYEETGTNTLAVYQSTLEAIHVEYTVNGNKLYYRETVQSPFAINRDGSPVETTTTLIFSK